MWVELGPFDIEPTREQYQNISKTLWQTGYAAFLQGNHQGAFASWVQMTADDHMISGDAVLALHRFTPENIEISKLLYKHRKTIGELQEEFESPIASTMRPLGISKRPLISASDAAVAYSISLAQNGKTREAQRVLDRQSNIEITMYLAVSARVAYEAGNYDEVLRIAPRLENTLWQDEIEVLVGACYIHLGDVEQASECFEQVRERDANQTATLLASIFLAHIYQQDDQEYLAREIAEESIAKQSKESLHEAEKLATELALSPMEIHAAKNMSPEDNEAWRLAVYELEHGKPALSAHAPDDKN